MDVLLLNMSVIFFVVVARNKPPSPFLSTLGHADLVRLKSKD